MDNSVEFFEGLSVFGWLGVLIWVLLPVAVFIKQKWFFNYEERKPQTRIFDEYCYTFERQVIFMAVRFVLLVLFSLGVGKILTMM